MQKTKVQKNTCPCSIVRWFYYYSSICGKWVNTSDGLNKRYLVLSIPKCADKKIYLVTRQKLDRISQHLYSNRYIEVIVLKTWFQKLLVSCFRRKIMYFSFKVSWYIWVLLKFETLSCVLFVLPRKLILFQEIWLLQDLMLIKRVINCLRTKPLWIKVLTVDIFFRTFYNIFHHNCQIWSEFRKYILQILLDVNAFIFLIHENYCQFLKRPKYLLEIIVIPGYN